MSASLVVSIRDGSLWGIEFRKKRGGQYACSRVKSYDFKDLAGRQDVIAVVDIKPFYFSRERVTKGPQEAIKAQLIERAEQTGIFESSPEVFYKPEIETGMYVECATCAVDPRELDLILERFVGHSIGLKSLFHRAIAIASLLANQVSDGSAIVVYGDESGGGIVIIDSDGLKYIRNLKFDEFLGLSEGVIREEIDLAVGQYRRTTGSDVSRIFAFGAVRQLLSEAESVRGLEWCPEASQEDLEEYPELFGALLAPVEFMLLPQPWIAWNKHVGWAKRVAVGMMIVAVINGALAGYLYREEKKIRELTTAKAQVIRAKAEKISRKIPLEKLKFVDVYAEELEAFKSEPRMDEFLAWLAQTIPSGFKITNLTIKKPSSQPAGDAVLRGRLPSGEGVTQGQQHYFVVTLSVGSVASFDEAHRVFQRILQAMHSRYAVSRSNLRFSDSESTAECSFELKLGNMMLQTRKVEK